MKARIERKRKTSVQFQTSIVSRSTGHSDISSGDSSPPYVGTKQRNADRGGRKEEKWREEGNLFSSSSLEASMRVRSSGGKKEKGRHRRGGEKEKIATLAQGGIPPWHAMQCGGGVNWYLVETGREVCIRIGRRRLGSIRCLYQLGKRIINILAICSGELFDTSMFEILFFINTWCYFSWYNNLFQISFLFFFRVC